VALDETRELASEQGTKVLGERIERDAGDTTDEAPELLANVDSVDAADQLRNRSPEPEAEVLPVLEEPEVVLPVAGSNLTEFPFAPDPALPQIDSAWISCGLDGLRIWSAVSPPGSVVTARITLPADGTSVVYEAVSSAELVGATAGEWRSFPGDPSERLEQVDALCLEPTWPISVTVEDPSGKTKLRAALRVEVSDEGWTDAWLESLPVLIPDPDVPVVPVPWKASNGMVIGAVVLQCGEASVEPMLQVSSETGSVGETRQFVSIAGSETWPRSYTASGRVPDGAITALDEWMDTGAPVQEEIVGEICSADTWRVYVSVSDGADAQVKVLVEAPVLKAIPTAE